jgi:hypothetical protein
MRAHDQRAEVTREHPDAVEVTPVRGRRREAPVRDEAHALPLALDDSPPERG